MERRNGTQRRGLGRRVGLQGHFAKGIQIDLQGPGHGLQKAARAGGAFVVHGELGHRPLIGHADRLGILTAYVHQHPGFRQDLTNAPGMARNLRHRGHSPRYPLPSVPGGHRPVDVGRRQARLAASSWP